MLAQLARPVVPLVGGWRYTEGVFGLSKRTLIVLATLIVVVVLFAFKHNGNASAGDSGSSTCQVTVTADVLNVRASPAGSAKVVDTLHKGDEAGATKTVRGGYREMSANHWAAEQFLRPNAHC
ncbi:MAG: SH3 domain-containing protein [Sciscionella sp.]|nr:SH3 domain-containing protein [Sciscionella sp.]